MHDRFRRGSVAAAEARAPNQPESEAPASPADVACSQPRREQSRSVVAAMIAPSRSALVVMQDLRAVAQGPEDVAQRALASSRGRAVLDILHQPRLLLWPRQPSQGGEKQRLDLAGRIEERAGHDRAERVIAIGL